MNNAPAVYVPIQPEGNGLTVPTLLSLLAHGIVVGLLIYTYQMTEIETIGSIETVMVSPEQLAEMQGQILANQAAASEAALLADSAAGAISSAPPNPNEADSAATTDSAVTSQQVPVFIRSDEAPNEPVFMTPEHQQRLAEQERDYQESMNEWAMQQDNAAMEKLERVEQNKQREISEEREKLKEFRNKQNNPPKIERPTASQRNIEITAGSSGNAGKNYSLSDGQSTISGDTSTASTTTGSSRSATSGRGTSNSEILSLIRRNYSPPIAAKGTTQRTTLTITVNANGDVVNVSASGADSAVNEAAKQAVLNTRSFPIDTSDPKYPTFSVQFNGSN